MKAQRRHELKENALARGLENLPEVSRTYGSKIMLGLIAALLVFVLIRYRISSGRERAELAATSLNSARQAIEQLRSGLAMVMGARPEQLASLRQQILMQAEDSIDATVRSTDDPQLLAEARVARGDLYWEISNFPDLPGATTNPALRLARTNDEFLKEAADAYQAVLDDRSSPWMSVITARFGLANIAENRRQWDAAGEYYQKIIDDTTTPQPFKNEAVERLGGLEDLKTEPLIGPPATDEALKPGTSQPATTPATTTGTTTPPATAPEPDVEKPDDNPAPQPDTKQPPGTDPPVEKPAADPAPAPPAGQNDEKPSAGQ